MKYIFAKSCIIRIYFAYILCIKVRYICQNIFDVYVTYIPRPSKYIFVPKSCI